MDSPDARPLPLDLSHLFSETTKQRLPSKMKEYYKFFQIPGVGNLAGGLPNVQFFPYDTLEAQIAKPERWEPAGDPAAERRPADHGGASHVTVPKAVGPDAPADPAERIDLAGALQYGQAQGYPPLLSWVRQFTRENLHPDVPYSGGPDVALTVGSTDGFAKTLELFVNPWSPATSRPQDRPGLLCETFVYGSIIGQAAPKGVQMVPVAADEGGMCVAGPGGLDDVLANWDVSKGRRPHLMYTVTIGHNPTGIVLGLARRRDIYATCSKYDVVIVEDDPYWFLQFPSAAAQEAASRNQAPPPPPESAPEPPPRRPSSGYGFLDSLTPSFLSIDVDGRVVRLDTFSKMAAPGCRLGWVTAQPALVERYVRIAEATTQQPSGFVQSLVASLVLGNDRPAAAAALSAFAALRTPRERAAFAGWHTVGWVRWLEGLRGAYEARMARLCRVLDAGAFQLKQGTPALPRDADWGVVTKTRLVHFRWPRGGMFVWLRVNFEAHPLWRAAAPDASFVADGPALSTALLIFLTTRPFLVLVSPGSMFAATDEIRRAAAWAYFRLCFAAVTDDVVDACAHRFVAGLHRFWKIKKLDEIRALLDLAPKVSSDLESQTDDGCAWPGC